MNSNCNVYNDTQHCLVFKIKEMSALHKRNCVYEQTVRHLEQIFNTRYNKTKYYATVFRDT